jgi:hypothetical protein
MAMKWLDSPPADFKFDKMVISGHGASGSVGPVTLAQLQDPNSDAYKFFAALKKKMAPNGVIELRTCCSAQGADGRNFLKEMSHLSGAKVIGYDDWYAINPHGFEYTATPNGMVRRTDKFRNYQGSWEKWLNDTFGPYLP